jgi:hypothetical protein
LVPTGRIFGSIGMAQPPLSPIFSPDEERLIIHSLGARDSAVQKVLQDLEKKLRSGRFPADSRRLRSAVMACLSRENLSIKRWAVNVLVQLGVNGTFEELNDLVPHCANDPDLLASVVRLLFSGMTEVAAIQFMKNADFSIEGMVLIAGSEFSTKLKKRLIDERIPLENAASDQLRAGIVLTGRGKAPENLFLAKHPNAVALSELNLHDEPGVVKYALWGMAELEIDHKQLKIPIDEIDTCEEQIRKWVYRLIFASPAGLENNLDLISHVARDDSAIVRLEGAIGLRRNFSEAAVEDIVRWFVREGHEQTKNAIIDHFCFNISRSESYSEIVGRMYSEDQRRGVIRERIEAGVQGTDYYGKFRSIEIREEASSFLPPFEAEGVFGMKKIEQNFNQSTIGAVTGEGAIAVGGVTVNQVGISPDALLDIVKNLLEFAHRVDDPTVSEQGVKIADELKAKPSKGIVERAIGWLNLATSGAKAGSELYNAGSGLIEDLSSLPVNF